MHAYLMLTLYSAAIVAVSLLGGWLPSWLHMTHTQVQCTISFVGGFMLGIGLLHLLPHGIAQAGSVDLVLLATLLGLLFTFFMIRFFHFHQHLASISELEPYHDHGSERGCRHDISPGGIHELGWTGIAFGLGIHTILDGVALGAAVSAESRVAAPWFPGLGVFLAVLLHKPLDAFSITSLMTASGWSSQARIAVNLSFALMCPLGAILFLTGTAHLDVDQARLLGMTLGFSTGVFLCISLGDLLPELQFHRHDRLKLSAAMLAGVGLAYAVSWWEPGESHGNHDHGARGLPSATQRLGCSSGLWGESTAVSQGGAGMSTQPLGVVRFTVLGPRFVPKNNRSPALNWSSETSTFFADQSPQDDYNALAWNRELTYLRSDREKEPRELSSHSHNLAPESTRLAGQRMAFAICENRT